MHEEVLQDDARVAELARHARAAGTFALDLEFVSESRYVPDLGLVQVGFGDPDAPTVAAVDPLAADPRPIFELLADPDVRTVLHGARADLALVSDRYGIVGRGVIDSQIAAGFLGYGEQIGFGKLIAQILDFEPDKGAQFTDWLKRPLDPEQLRYALDDVRLLMPAWADLEAQLERRGRMAWVEAECLRMTEEAAHRPAPEAVYEKISGWRKLNPSQAGALRALAAWRERTALDLNRPPARILPDRVLTTLARKPPKHADQLEQVRAMPRGTAKRHAPVILEILEEGRRQPVETPGGQGRRDPLVDALSPIVSGIVKSRCQEALIASRFVARRRDIDEVLRWWRDGGRKEEAREHPVLHGWRRDLVGEEILAFLDGARALVVDAEAPGGFRLVDPS